MMSLDCKNFENMMVDEHHGIHEGAIEVVALLFLLCHLKFSSPHVFIPCYVLNKRFVQIYLTISWLEFTTSEKVQIVLGERKFNVRQSDVNLSPLTISCSRVPLVHDRVYCMPYGRWALVCRGRVT
jgi:hypothetical protein